MGEGGAGAGAPGVDRGRVVSSMSTAARSVGGARAPGVVARIGRSVVHGALDRLVRGRIELVDGADRRVFGDAASDDRVAVTVRDARFYASVALGGSLGAAESFMEGDWECDDLAGLFRVLLENRAALGSIDSRVARAVRPVSRLGYALQRNSRKGSRRNIAAHYDLSNEFFALWLDPSMTYSCGIFGSDRDTLEEAQAEKLDRACRKLDLKAGDHLLEIGTGWGSAAIHAATHYGCTVTTTTISERQHALARERIDAAGLSDRITLLKKDYRDLEGVYDKVLSIEMIEAVGHQYLDSYFRTITERLKPEGLALVQAITIREHRWAEAARTRDFLKKYIFPGSCLLSMGSMSSSMARTGDLRVVDVEDLGVHYAQTLRRWRAMFMGRLDEVRGMGFDERFCRMWRYYLEYCEGAFEARHCSVVQVLMDRSLARRGAIPDRGIA